MDTTIGSAEFAFPQPRIFTVGDGPLAVGVATLAGAAVGRYLRYFLVSLPIVAQVGRHINYVAPYFYIATVMFLYVLGTYISSLCSRRQWIRLFGVASFLSFGAASALNDAWFISALCFFAAALSGILLLHFLCRRAFPPEGWHAAALAGNDIV